MWLRHSNITTTADIYVHVDEDAFSKDSASIMTDIVNTKIITENAIDSDNQMKKTLKP